MTADPRASLRARVLSSYLRKRIKPRLRARPTDPTAIDIARRRMETTARAFAPKRHGCAVSTAIVADVPVEHVATRAQPIEPAPRVLPEARLALDEICRFIRARVSHHG